MEHGAEGSSSGDGAVRPDRFTGLPRPPRAPVVGRPAEDGTPSGYAESGDVWAGRSAVPDAFGPPLEAFRPPDRRAVTAGALAAIALVAAYATWDLSDYGALAVVFLVVMTAVAAAAAVLVLVVPPPVVVAGAQWLGVHRPWVETYDLSAIAVQERGQSQDLVVTDRTGRTVGVDLQSVQGNPELWDLVYAGVRYSAAHGADVDPYAAAVLLLDV